MVEVDCFGRESVYCFSQPEPSGLLEPFDACSVCKLNGFLLNIPASLQTTGFP